MFDPENGAMLEGIKIIDMTGVVFGPLATQILADFGAEVIKVEAPGGDVLRHVMKPKDKPGMSAVFMALNRGKKSIVLDLREEDDRSVMKDLLADADVFIHNVRMEGMRRLGFGYDDVNAFNPDLIYVHCAGFGSEGPYAKLQAYDDIIQAASGAATLLPRVDGNPQPRFLPSLIADKVGGLSAVYATMAAIIHRMRSSEGQFVEVPMFEAFSKFMLQEHMNGHYYDPPMGEAGYQRQLDPDRQPCPTSDGYITFLPNRMPQWQPIFEVLGEPDYLDKHGLKTDLEIRAAQPEIYRHVRTLTVKNTSDHWVRELRAVGVPCMQVRDLGQMIDDPHLTSVGFFNTREHPTEGTVRDMVEPCRFSGWRPKEPSPTPLLDEDGAALRDAITQRKANT